MILVLPDLHLPDIDFKYQTAILKFLLKEKVEEIIFLGDLGEFGSCSMHDGSGYRNFLDDCKSVKDFIASVYQLAQCKITWACGNHETRLQRKILSLAPTLQDSIDLVGLCTPDKVKINFIPEHNLIERGNCFLLHGHQFLTGAFISKYHAQKAIDLYGIKDKFIIYAHTHRLQYISSPSHTGCKTAINIGCGRTLQADWTRGRPNGWAHGFLTIVDGYPILHHVIDGHVY